MKKYFLSFFLSTAFIAVFALSAGCVTPSPPVADPPAPIAAKGADYKALYGERLTETESARSDAIAAGAEDDALTEANAALLSGDAMLDAARNLADGSDYENACAKLDEAKDAYGTASKDAAAVWEGRAELSLRGASQAKAEADSVRAENAAKTEYGAASALLDGGKAAFSAKDFMKTVADCDESSALFLASMKIAQDRRAEAEAALLAAQAKAAKSGEAAAAREKELVD